MSRIFLDRDAAESWAAKNAIKKTALMSTS